MRAGAARGSRGEVAIYDQQLGFRFEWLSERDPDAVTTPRIFMVFDLLFCDGGRELSPRPLRDRRARLEDVVAGSELVFPVRRLAADPADQRGGELDLTRHRSYRPDMERRRFLLTSLAGAVATPLAAEAQQSKTYRLGFLGAASASQYASQINAMRRGLRDLGYVEGKNLIIEYRWAEGRYERLGNLAGELVRLKVDVIITHGTPGSQAAKQATRSIPIVMAVVGNPEETGLILSIGHPGGNLTGTSFFFTELNAKRLQIAKDGIPPLTRVAALTNPDNPAHASVMTAMEEMAKSLSIEFHRAEARRPDDLEATFAAIKRRADAIAVIDDGMLIANARRIVDLAVRHRLPTVGFKELVEAGGLIAYAVDFPETFRQSMALVDRILKGAKPGDLPIQRATKFELIVNLRTAKALGLTIPPSLLLRADQVIE